MNRLVEQPQKLNAGTRDAWEDCPEHREVVTSRLVRTSQADRERICILGAGNCNDLDLSALAGAFCEVHLVDLDGEAMHAGLTRQNVEGDSRFVLHEQIDVAAIVPALAHFSPEQ